MVSKPVTCRSIWRSVLLISVLACSGPQGGAKQKADLALVGGDIHTLDPTRPRATAVAIAGDKIIAVGTDAEIRAFGATREIALGGKTVTPGLIDAHCHLYGLGVDMERVSVRQLDSVEAVAQVVADAAKQRPASEWLLGRGWDQNRWPGQQFPTKAALDAVVSDRPVLLRRVDGHAIWVNTAALQAAKVTKDTKDPAGGKIIRDDKGEPTGVFIDNAVDLIDRAVPSDSTDAIERRIRAAAKVAVSVGLTGVHDMGIGDETAAVYTRLAEANELPLRVYAFLSGDAANLARVREAEIALTAAGRTYVPEARIPQAAPRIQDGDIIAATSTVAGLDVAHTGLALWVEGALHLLHAPLVGDSVEVSTVPLAERIQSITGQDGILVARPIDATGSNSSLAPVGFTEPSR